MAEPYKKKTQFKGLEEHERLQKKKVASAKDKAKRKAPKVNGIRKDIVARPSMKSAKAAGALAAGMTGALMGGGVGKALTAWSGKGRSAQAGPGKAAKKTGKPKT